FPVVGPDREWCRGACEADAPPGGLAEQPVDLLPPRDGGRADIRGGQEEYGRDLVPAEDRERSRVGVDGPVGKCDQGWRPTTGVSVLGDVPKAVESYHLEPVPHAANVLLEPLGGAGEDVPVEVGRKRVADPVVVEAVEPGWQEPPSGRRDPDRGQGPSHQPALSHRDGFPGKREAGWSNRQGARPPSP